MKKMILFFLTVCLFVACGAVFAEAPDGAKIGVAAGIAGEVKAVSPAGEERVLKGGDALFQGDIVTTGADSKMQILLLDQTIFTIGADSSIKLSEFIYDPATSEGKVNADVIRGAFRFISGKVAHHKAENMSVDLPVGTIGIRGTLVAGQSEGQRSLVVLLGGPNGQGSGAINVSNTVNGEPVGVDIDQGGFGTVIEGENTAPITPFEVPAQDLMNLANALGQQVSQGAPGGAAETVGGTGEAPDAPDTSSLPAVGDLVAALSAIADLQEQTTTAAQSGLDNKAINAASSTYHSDAAGVIDDSPGGDDGGTVHIGGGGQ